MQSSQNEEPSISMLLLLNQSEDSFLPVRQRLPRFSAPVEGGVYHFQVNVRFGAFWQSLAEVVGRSRRTTLEPPNIVYVFHLSQQFVLCLVVNQRKPRVVSYIYFLLGDDCKSKDRSCDAAAFRTTYECGVQVAGATTK